jgi:hypothetical protein
MEKPERYIDTDTLAIVLSATVIAAGIWFMAF